MIWRKVDAKGRLPLGKDALRVLGAAVGDELEIVANPDGSATIRKAKTAMAMDSIGA